METGKSREKRHRLENINRRKKTGRERSRPVECLVIYKVKAIKI